MKRSTLLLLFALVCGFNSLSKAASDAFVRPKYKSIILAAPVPDYPSEVRYFPGESGVYRVKINAQTGAVDEVGVLRRASQQKLDAVMIFELFKWKFKPGSIKELDLPVEFDRGYVRPELKNAVLK